MDSLAYAETPVKGSGGIAAQGFQSSAPIVAVLTTPEGRAYIATQFFQQWQGLQNALLMAQNPEQKKALAERAATTINKFPMVTRDSMADDSSIISRMEQHWNKIAMPEIITTENAQDMRMSLWERAQAIVESDGVDEMVIDFTGCQGGKTNGGIELAREMVHIREYLEANGKKMVGYSNGITASMAVPCMLACSERFVTRDARIMYHEVRSLVTQSAVVKPAELEEAASSMRKETMEVARFMAEQIHRDAPKDERDARISEEAERIYTVMTEAASPEAGAVGASRDAWFTGESALTRGLATHYSHLGAGFMDSRPIGGRPGGQKPNPTVH